MKKIDIPNRSSNIETALAMVFSNILLSPTILIHSSVKRQVSKYERNLTKPYVRLGNISISRQRFY
jgi:hypothetical protein